MKRKYRITAYTEGLDLRETVPAELKTVEVFSYPLAGLDAYMWTFEEPEFPLIPRLRAWLKAQRTREVTEEGLRWNSAAEELTAPLVRLSNGEVLGAEVLEASVTLDERCAGCGFVLTRVRDDARLRLRLPKKSDFGLFWMKEAHIKVASAKLYQALCAADLARGLSTFPVEVEGRESGACLGLYSHVNLGWPAAPFGLTGNPCPTCGRHVIRSLQTSDTRTYPGLPRYSFYHIFERPPEPAQWMWTELFGQTSLYIAGAARDWLVSEGAELVGAGYRQRKEFNFVPHGWYPDEVEEAFLDARYRE